MPNDSHADAEQLAAAAVALNRHAPVLSELGLRRLEDSLRRGSAPGVSCRVPIHAIDSTGVERVC